MSIADKINQLQTDKINIANAITAKGGVVASGDGFDDFATDINNIPTGVIGQVVTISKSQAESITNTQELLDTLFPGKSSISNILMATLIYPEAVSQMASYSILDISELYVGVWLSHCTQRIDEHTVNPRQGVSPDTQAAVKEGYKYLCYVLSPDS